MNNRSQRNVRIASLNDALRRNLFHGPVLVSAGIEQLPHTDKRAVLEKVRDDDDFTADNDPSGRHDSGTVEYRGIKVTWIIASSNIGFRDADSNPGSNDPNFINRVLIVQLAEEN